MCPASAIDSNILWSDFLSIFPSNPSFFSLSAISLYNLDWSSITLYSLTASKIVFERRRRRTFKTETLKRIAVLVST